MEFFFLLQISSLKEKKMTTTNCQNRDRILFSLSLKQTNGFFDFAIEMINSNALR